ncbi:MAG: metalloregulator ArsR/SmtB family transcription factor [Opitutales bacterium]
MDLIEIYKCLCDETRLRILHLLTKGPLCVCHFQQLLDLPQVPVSKHLAYLRDRQMVEAHRRGQWVIYALPAKRSRELELQLQCLQDCLQTNRSFRADLQRFKKLQPECNWVPKALKSPKLTSPKMKRGA